MDFIKSWFVEPYNKTGCRYLVVDAYNEDVPVAFIRRMVLILCSAQKSRKNHIEVLFLISH